MKVWVKFFLHSDAAHAADVEAAATKHASLFEQIEITQQVGGLNFMGDVCNFFQMRLDSVDIDASNRTSFVAAIESAGGSCHIVEQIKYSKKEVLDAPACVLSVPRRPVGEIPERPVTVIEGIFDPASGCERCWADARQIGDLILRGFKPRPSEQICQTLDGHILVHSAARALLLDLLAPSCFRTVRGPKGVAIPNWYQLLSAFELPKLDAKTRGVVTENQCPVCRQDGHFGTTEHDLVPYYGGVDWNSISVAATWERFGNSGRLLTKKYIPRVATTVLVLGQRAVEALIELHNRGIKFTPVRVTGA